MKAVRGAKLMWHILTSCKKGGTKTRGYAYKGIKGKEEFCVHVELEVFRQANHTSKKRHGWLPSMGFLGISNPLLRLLEEPI